MEIHKTVNKSDCNLFCFLYAKEVQINTYVHRTIVHAGILHVRAYNAPRRVRFSVTKLMLLVQQEGIYV